MNKPKDNDDLRKKINYYFSCSDTVVVFGLGKRMEKTVTKACENLKVKVFYADCVPDLIAVPSFLIIADPGGIKKSEMEDYYDFISQADDKDYQVLFTRQPKLNVPHKIKKCFVKTPERFDYDYFKFTILKRKAAYNRRLTNRRKYDKKIFRLMYIIRALRSQKIVFKAELCNEFSVTPRTIERDIEMLESLGDCIEYDSVNKGYRLIVDII